MSERVGLRALGVIILSIIIAILLSIIPLPTWAGWLRPRWVLLVSIYWGMMLPYRYSIGFAWLIGLLMDFIQGTIIGEQALLLSFFTYIVIVFHLRIQLLSLMQRTFFVFALSLLYQIGLYAMQAIISHAVFTWHYWLSSLTSALFWPWVYSILRNWQKRFKVVDATTRRFSYNRE